jgi:hypothetical protein
MRYDLRSFYLAGHTARCKFVWLYHSNCYSMVAENILALPRLICPFFTLGHHCPGRVLAMRPSSWQDRCRWWKATLAAVIKFRKAVKAANTEKTCRLSRGSWERWETPPVRQRSVQCHLNRGIRVNCIVVRANDCILHGCGNGVDNRWHLSGIYPRG